MNPIYLNTLGFFHPEQLEGLSPKESRRYKVLNICNVLGYSPLGPIAALIRLITIEIIKKNEPRRDTKEFQEFFKSQRIRSAVEFFSILVIPGIVLFILDRNRDKGRTKILITGDVCDLNLIDSSTNSLKSGIEKYYVLQKLQIARENLRNLPENFGNLKALKSLELWQNQLRTLPESFGNLAALEKLVIFENQLTSLPDSFGNLTALKELRIGKNEISTLPENFGKLVSLQTLEFYQNRLISLPQSFGNLSSLRSLHLGWNSLQTLPENFGNLTALTYLSLFNNQFTTIPECIFNLSPNCSVSFDNNPLTPEAIANAQRRVNQPGYNGPHITFSIQDRTTDKPLRSLQEELTDWCDKEYHKSFLILDEKNQNGLNLWLMRLKETKDFKTSPENMKRKIKDFLEWLSVEKDKDIRTSCFELINSATDTCGDRVALSVSDLLLNKKVAQSKHLNLDDLKDLIIGVYRKDLLFQIAQKKCESLYMVDPIEVHLVYQTKLKEKLKLPLDIDRMLYSAEVTEKEIKFAEREILEKTGSIEKQIEILLRNEIWKKAISIDNRFAQLEKELAVKRDQESEIQQNLMIEIEDKKNKLDPKNKNYKNEYEILNNDYKKIYKEMNSKLEQDFNTYYQLTLPIFNGKLE